MDIDKLKYPIGRFNCPDHISEEQLGEWISTLEHFPYDLRKLVHGLSEEQLNTPYRPGGWTVRQVIHHVYDSHHNCYTRFKWALTEDVPLIKAYNEADWAQLFDYQSAPLELSFKGLEVIHAKLVLLLKGMSPEDFKKEFIHPEDNEHVSLAINTGVYAWHSRHHYAHIANLLKRKGWN